MDNNDKKDLFQKQLEEIEPLLKPIPLKVGDEQYNINNNIVI